MKIAILEDYQDAVRHLPCFSLLVGHEVDVFTEPMDDDAMAERLARHEAVVLIRERTHMTAALMDRLPRLRLISQTGKVSGNVDMAAAQQRGITVLEGVGDPTAPAELSWALLMAAYRRLPQYVSQLQGGHWQRVSGEAVHDTIGRALKGDVLGIWGYGKIGQRMARYARAFDMEVLVWGRATSLELARTDGHRVATSKEAFFAEAEGFEPPDALRHLQFSRLTQSANSAKLPYISKNNLLYRLPESNRHDHHWPRDFKSLVSTYFTTAA